MPIQELVLIELPADISTSELTKAKTLTELENMCSRLSPHLEEDLKKRLYLYQEDPHNSTWKAEPKIKKIYKYHLRESDGRKKKGQSKQGSVEAKQQKKRIRSLKKDQ